MHACKINILLFKDSEWWEAQCLEYDIAAQGRTLPEAMAEIEHAIVCHLAVNAEAGEQPFEGIPPAPEYFSKLFEERAVPTKAPPFKLPKNVPPAWLCKQPEMRVC